VTELDGADISDGVRMAMRRRTSGWTAAVVGGVIAASGAAAAPADVASGPSCTPSWSLVGTDTFRGPNALTRSQGVTTDSKGWIFSWQGGLERTTNRYVTDAVATIPPRLAVQPTVRRKSNFVGDNHIGDIDYYRGLIYAPVEDGGTDAGVTTLNAPEYQHPYIALYDAKTLAYTGVHYALDKKIHEAGVPWVAVDAPRAEVYTAEWDMPHDRLNVFNTHMRFLRFLPLVYPSSLGPGFHLSRIQGAKVFGTTMYATRDDDDKTVYSIDLRTGLVSRLFALKPQAPAELEGLSVRRTPDGALLHVIIILDNDTDRPLQASHIRAVMEHFAPVYPNDCS
jgi:hypothetical protein